MSRLEIEAPDPVLFAHQATVRITDLNYGNHLGHDRLVSVLHEARARFFRSLGVEEWDVEGRATAVVELAVRYRTEALFGQTLRVELGVGAIGSRSLELVYRVGDAADGRDVALASTVLVFLDRETRRVVRVPKSLLAAIGS